MIPLRPLSITEMLDGAFTAIKFNPKTILVASATVAIVVNVVNAVATYLIERSAQSIVTNSGSGSPNFNVHTAVLLSVLAFLILGVTILGHTILTGLLTVTVGQAVLGRKETLGSAWRATRRRFWPLVGTLSLLVVFLYGGWLLGIGVSILGAVALTAGAHLTGGFGVLIGVVGCGAATVFLGIAYVRWSVAVPVVMLESTGPLRSLGRSWRLVRHSWWRVWWILVLAELITYIAGLLIKAPFAIGAGGISGTFVFTTQSHASALGLAISAVGGILASTLTAPLLAGIVVLVYTDLLMRREGMDIKLQAAAASGGPGYASPLGAGSAAGANWAGPAGPPGWASPAGEAGRGAPKPPEQPGWNFPASGPGTAPVQPGQPNWTTPAAGTGTGTAQTGQPGWNTPPASPAPPGQPGGIGWEDTVGWPERPRPAGGPGPEDGGTGTGTPDPSAW